MDKLRVRWYALSITRSRLRRLAEALPAAAYNETRGHGFILDEVRANSIVGRYVERTERAFVTRNPFGEESRQTLTVYVDTSFRLVTERPGLEVVDAPRSSRLLFSQIAALADFSVTVSPISIDPLLWLEALESNVEKALVHRLEFSEIAFGGGTQGMLRLDGATDVRSAGNQILGKRSRFVRRAAAQVWDAGVSSWSAIVGKDAQAYIHAPDVHTARGILHAALVRALG